MALLDGHVRYLENFRAHLDTMAWRENGRINMRVPFIFERFHLTHVCHYPDVFWEDVQEIDERLAAMDTKLCLLTVDAGDLEQRITRRRDEHWREFLTRHGNSVEAVVRHYLVQQEKFRELSAKSSMETCLIDTSAVEPSKTLEVALAFWGAI